jgi:dUTP pyrophosphatase
MVRNRSGAGPIGIPTIGIYFQFLDGGTPQIPYKKFVDDAGWDLYTSREQTVEGRRAANVHTDIAVAIPEGWAGHLLGRSSTLKRYGLMVSPAIIDAGYRSELFIQVTNMRKTPVHIFPGIRIAQMVMIIVPQVTWRQITYLPASPRQGGGFGSTGV